MDLCKRYDENLQLAIEENEASAFKLGMEELEDIATEWTVNEAISLINSHATKRHWERQDSINKAHYG
jgi:hypothetical protein